MDNLILISSLFLLFTACEFDEDDQVSTPTLETLDEGSVIITEIMSNPASVSDLNGEWFEINSVLNKIDFVKKV